MSFYVSLLFHLSVLFCMAVKRKSHSNVKFTFKFLGDLELDAEVQRRLQQPPSLCQEQQQQMLTS